MAKSFSHEADRNFPCNAWHRSFSTLSASRLSWREDCCCGAFGIILVIDKTIHPILVRSTTIETYYTLLHHLLLGVLNVDRVELTSFFLDSSVDTQSP